MIMAEKKTGVSGLLTKIAVSVVTLICVIALAYGAYLWFFCRIYVPAGMMAVVTAKTG